MNNWQKEIIKGMIIIKEACSKNSKWEKCIDCPFYNYCGTEVDIIPTDWDIDI